MVDIATIWDAAAGIGDWTLSIGRSNVIVDARGASIRDGEGRQYLAAEEAYTPGTGLVSDQDLQTAVLISLFTDAEAGADDVIPDGSGDPRGWWAGPIGSKLWLRERSKATPDLPELIRNDIGQALQWLIDDGVVASIAVTAEYQDAKTIAAQVVLRRQDSTQMAMQFARVWETI
ncbi:phage gp46-like protein [Sphingomonas sp. BE270]|uniref:phage GP46 family protein n=1 Tax=Sphingomonas sp. BE270 TaxID=2817726 RepID=UPI002863E391|nr:phage GP46 family protein [Sphingomonas sp. BE270]MDR7259883.1 phage gp46-like protein [Sphingomonas sp. BE270]